MFERLSPGGEPVSAAEALASARLGALAAPERPYVFLNFVSTLDGRAALDGSTRPLGGPADLEMLLALRDVADAVLIGPGTVRAEGYARLVGGEFGRHGAVESGRVNVSARPHVTTRGLPRSFQITDEFYEFTAPVPAHARVLARLDPESVPDELGSTLPLAWARRYGDGRVFYNALGHRKETWRDPNFRRLTSRGLAWALGS